MNDGERAPDRGPYKIIVTLYMTHEDEPGSYFGIESFMKVMQDMGEMSVSSMPPEISNQIMRNLEEATLVSGYTEGENGHMEFMPVTIAARAVSEEEIEMMASVIGKVRNQVEGL